MNQPGLKRINTNNGVNGSMAKKLRPDVLTLRFLLMSKHAGGIIGKGGQTIKRLRTENNANVNVPDSNSNERVLSIGATQENALQVLLECLPLFHEPPYAVNANSSQNKQPFEVNFLVHSSYVRDIIGTGGFKLKEIREQSNTNIKILKECLPMSTERVMVIGGGANEIVSALKLVLDVILGTPMQAMLGMYDPSQNDWSGGGSGQDIFVTGGASSMVGAMRGRGGIRGGGMVGRGGSRGGFNFNQTAGFSRIVTNDFEPDYGHNLFDFSQGNSNVNNSNNNDAYPTGPFEVQIAQVSIPNDLAGAIIGRGGERIRTIRQKSGADIKIQEKTGENKNERIIAISGTLEQIQYGQFLMQQSVRQYSGKPK